MAEIWGQRDRVSSKMTPRFLADGDSWMAASPMVMGKLVGAGMFLEWKRRNSVLLSLSLRPFSGIQRHIPAIHASSLCRACCCALGQVGLS